MKYSVIIPAYNAEKTIRRCIDSITSQNRADVEIIVVNDGSTDGTDIICKDLQAKHSSIIYISKDNGGVSSARNAGLSIANSEFVMFVDSDDYIYNKCFDIVDKYIGSNADFYQFGFTIVSHDSVKEEREFSECHTNTPTDKEVFISNGVITRSINSPCAKIFKRKIINEKGLRFRENLSTGEDLTFVFTFLLAADKIERTTDKIYFADISNEDSLSRKYRADLPEQLLGVYDNMIKALHDGKTENGAINNALAWLFYRNAYSVAKDISNGKFSFLERREKLKAMCNLFNSKKVAPVGIKCKVIAIPIRFRLIGLIDTAFQAINKLK